MRLKRSKSFLEIAKIKERILKAAVKVVANEGLRASTQKIGRIAGVSEGTVYRYFKTKEFLLNELYFYIVKDSSAYIKKGMALYGEAKESFPQAKWSLYLDWGLKNHQAIRVLEWIKPANVLTMETREKSKACFSDREIESPTELFFFELIKSLANQAILKIISTEEEKHKNSCRDIAFSMIWNGLLEKKDIHLQAVSRPLKQDLAFSE